MRVACAAMHAPPLAEVAPVSMGTGVTDLPDLVRHLLVKAMDQQARAMFRLTCRQAQDDVHASTTCLTWAPDAHQAGSAGPAPRQLNVASTALLPRAALAGCAPTLQGLCLAQARLGADGLSLLTSQLSSFRSLRLLNLAGNHIGSASLQALAQALHSISTTLQHLDLRDTHLSSSSNAALEGTLAPALSCLVHLTTLNLSSNWLSNGAAAALAPALPSLVHLVDLDLGKVAMRDAGAEALAPALSSLVHLTALKLGGNDLRDGAIAALSTSICTLTRLQCLDISCNQIGEGCLQDLAHMVAPLCELRELDFWWHNINMDYMQHDVEIFLRALAPTLARLSKMQHLTMHHAFISNVLEPVLCMMQGQTSLTSVHLKTTHMEDYEAVEVLQALLPMQHLRILHLTHHPIAWGFYRCLGLHVIHPLFEGLAKLTALEQLSLARNYLGIHDGEGTAALASIVLPRLQRLTQLNLCDNALDYESAVALAPGLASLRMLHTLDLEDNMLKIDAAEVLVHQLGGLPNMRLVILADNWVNGEELTPLRLMYPSLLMSLIDQRQRRKASKAR